MGLSRKMTRRAFISLCAGFLVLAGIATQAQEPPGPGEAHRATVRFTEGAFELVSLTPLSTVLPPSDEITGDPGTMSGFWFELQDPDGAPLYRRIIGDPVRLFFEGPGEAAGLAPARVSKRRTLESSGRPAREQRPRIKPSQRGVVHFRQVDSRAPAPEMVRASVDNELPVPADRDEGLPAVRTFTLLIPAAQDGDQLVLFSSPLEPGGQADPAAEVARFALQTTAPQGGAQ